MNKREKSSFYCAVNQLMTIPIRYFNLIMMRAADDIYFQ